MLQDFDRRLIVLNLAYLSMIVLVPFPTELLGEYGGGSGAVVLYALVVGTAALLGWVMLRYALRHGHVRLEARSEAAGIPARLLLPAIVFYASIPLSFLSPETAQLVWVGLLLDAFRRRG
jgi:uncharacterized membrane protein